MGKDEFGQERTALTKNGSGVMALLRLLPGYIEEKVTHFYQWNMCVGDVYITSKAEQVQT